MSASIDNIPGAPASPGAGRRPAPRFPLSGPRHFLEHYAILRAACFQRPRCLSVALIDVDRFHEFNELYSPQVGDQVLACVAQWLSEETRGVGLTVRYEGDRFLLSLPGQDEAQAVRRLDTLLQRARTGRCGAEQLHRPIEMRAGLVTCDPRELCSAHTLVERARAALHHAKLHRDQRIVCWSSICDAAAAPPTAAHVQVLGEAAAWLGGVRAQLHAMVEQSTKALVAAVEAKDPFTCRHSVNVAGYAEQLGRRLRLSPRQCSVLHRAAVLHDVGKIGVPDAILTKPGPLTDEEFAVVQRHPRMALDILAHLPNLAQVMPLILHHHERFDGTGYPAGLAGDRIPFGARILAAADAIDAMRSRRSYKQAYGVDKVIDELQAGSGRQFDPIVARAAIDLLRTECRSPRVHR